LFSADFHKSAAVTSTKYHSEIVNRISLIEFLCKPNYGEQISCASFSVLELPSTSTTKYAITTMACTWLGLLIAEANNRIQYHYHMIRIHIVLRVYKVTCLGRTIYKIASTVQEHFS